MSFPETFPRSLSAPSLPVEPCTLKVDMSHSNLPLSTKLQLSFGSQIAFLDKRTVEVPDSERYAGCTAEGYTLVFEADSLHLTGQKVHELIFKPTCPSASFFSIIASVTCTELSEASILDRTIIPCSSKDAPYTYNLQVRPQTDDLSEAAEAAAAPSRRPNLQMTLSRITSKRAVIDGETCTQESCRVIARTEPRTDNPLLNRTIFSEVELPDMDGLDFSGVQGDLPASGSPLHPNITARHARPQAGSFNAHLDDSE